MKYRIKKKLIHFYTSGNVAEDFVASRRKKVSVMRKIIRACFYPVSYTHLRAHETSV